MLQAMLEFMGIFHSSSLAFEARSEVHLMSSAQMPSVFNVDKLQLHELRRLQSPNPHSSRASISAGSCPQVVFACLPVAFASLAGDIAMHNHV